MFNPDEQVGADQRATWIRDMVDYYQETGQVRTEDLGRLLGEPNGETYMPIRDELCTGDNLLFS